ncbi:P-loop containing nucleoside triphosphate hydrolase protein, partial [Ceratobasidium sp. AG-I]
MDLTPGELALLDEPLEDRLIGPLTLEQSFVEATKAATGFVPHPWQVSAACALYSGKRDVLVLAGTGYGKTLPFVMNCFLRPDLIVWIVSPLNYIEMQQAKSFLRWGLRAIADVKNGKFQVVISSIESMTATNKLRPAIASPKLESRPQILVVDEAHCISGWTETGFRPLYATTGTLRRLMPPNTPVIAATATANEKVRKSIMDGSESAVGEIFQYFPSKTELPLSLIFVDSRSVGQTVLQALRDYVDPSLKGQIHIYHAFRSEFSKKVLAEGFQREEFRVLICTESLTMGADFRRVRLVINFLAPDSLQTWEQRAGRGARQEDIICNAVLMVQPSLFEGFS